VLIVLGLMTETAQTQQYSFNFTDARPSISTESGSEELRLVLGEFAGPLDLLLYLIKQEKVDLFDIPIARITDEYLRYLRLMQNLDISVAGDFLVMAATLIEIKSKMLLPRDPLATVEEEEIDPREELVQRLLEHQKYKAAAQMLWSRSTVEKAVYTRGKLETDEQNPEVSVGLFDLLTVFQKILARRKEEAAMEIQREELSMAEMLTRLRELVRRDKSLNLQDFFAQAISRRELVVAFLSVLELVKAAEITLTQTETFGDILAHAA
jgi:segregation and condensation protein A